MTFLRHFHKYAYEGYAEKSIFDGLRASNMFQTCPNDIRTPFLTILETFCTLLRDIEAILKKRPPDAPLKKKFSNVD